MRLWYLIPLVALGCIAAIAYFGQNKSEEDDFALLEKRQRDRQLQQSSEQRASSNPDAVFSALTAKGKGQPLPNHLESSPAGHGNWIVRKPGVDIGASIPFIPGSAPKPPSKMKPVHENPGFLGAKACQECHEKTFASFGQTAHYLTSQLATPESVRGALEDGENLLRTWHPDVSFKIFARDGKLIQRTTFFDWQFEIPMHIVTGSSKLAQTYLYWHDDQLFQCNVTYLTPVDSWINSPGFVDGNADYDRPIAARCLECHTTYIDYTRPPNHFTPETLITGISCERCHGPGREHVDFHRTNPSVKEAQFVTVPSDLPREQELQLCSQCHSTITDLKGRPYQFRPGDLLEDHYTPPKTQAGNSVHTSNQLERLGKSQCFRQSEMTCIDCHNPHQLERGDLKLFSQRCIKCHEPRSCGMSDSLHDRISENCIECHMPKRESENLRLDTASGSVFPPLRDHFIRIDQNAAKEFMSNRSDTQ